MTRISRRSFIRSTIALGGVLGVQGLTSGAVDAAEPFAGFGNLIPTAAQNTGETLLALPEGFKYNVLLRKDDIMSDGTPSPGNADGMAAFEYYDGKIRLVRNHELGAGQLLGKPELAFDPGAGGGTTTLTVDPHTRLLENSFVSLGGTIRNCAGGPTLWYSWLTCEETRDGPANLASLTKQHGYIFEVPACVDRQVEAVPLKAMGLLYSEATAIDPETGIVYITMDLNPGGIFRFIPKQPGVLSAGGKLQMLAVKNMPQYDTRIGQTAKELLRIDWVDITVPELDDDAGFAAYEAAYNADRLVSYKEGLEKGGATFARPEGMWYSRGSIFFSCTSGGNNPNNTPGSGYGQIWEILLRKNQVMRLVYESNDREILDAPDNITMSPRGTHIIICEDGSGDEYLHALQRGGNNIFRLAKNMVPGFEGSEWAGACFSPDGKTLFANLQGPSMTFAIWTDKWRGLR